MRVFGVFLSLNGLLFILCEREKFYYFLDLEQTQENIELVKNLENGHCLFQDLEGHVGELAVDPVWDDFVTAFNTTPTSEEHENEE